MASEKIELIVHPMCPYAQRPLYVGSFKGLDLEIIHVSVARPEQWFLDASPLGEVPALRVTKGNIVYNLTESLNISEYLESLPGPNLYPREPDGTVSHIEKGIIDVFIKNKIGWFADVYYNVINTKMTEELVREFKNVIGYFNGILENGGFVIDKILGRNEITFADVMLLPHVERLSVYYESLPQEYKECDISNLWIWHEKIRKMPWSEEHRIPPTRLINLGKIKAAKKFYGLDLPLSIYD